MRSGMVSDATLMTLAGIAYGHPSSIPGYVEQASPTAGNWSVAWIADTSGTPDNFAYMAVNADQGISVIAIRGTYPNPFSPAYWDDGNQDSPFGTMVAWPDAPDARISAGTSAGLKGVLAHKNEKGLTLQDAVAALSPGLPIIVTGHSLGGTLAPTLALFLAKHAPERSFSATTFAGLTPGNRAFAALFATQGVPVRRVYNTLDTVSYGWDKVWATRNFYRPSPRGGILVKIALLFTRLRLTWGKYDYAAVGEGVPLAGVLSAQSVRLQLVAYVIENLHQHMPATYLALLGAPPLPFRIGFGSVVLPREHPDAARLISSRPPTIYALHRSVSNEDQRASA
jgi:hypothetical protein